MLRNGLPSPPSTRVLPLNWDATRNWLNTCAQKFPTALSVNGAPGLVRLKTGIPSPFAGRFKPFHDPWIEQAAEAFGQAILDVREADNNPEGFRSNGGMEDRPNGLQLLGGNHDPLDAQRFIEDWLSKAGYEAEAEEPYFVTETGEAHREIGKRPDNRDDGILWVGDQSVSVSEPASGSSSSPVPSSSLDCPVFALGGTVTVTFSGVDATICAGCQTVTGTVHRIATDVRTDGTYTLAYLDYVAGNDIQRFIKSSGTRPEVDLDYYDEAGCSTFNTSLTRTGNIILSIRASDCRVVGLQCSPQHGSVFNYLDVFGVGYDKDAVIPNNLSCVSSSAVSGGTAVVTW